jgi:NAD(P)-dependent dehydrogenase (short-subunit alcohol dehydrogenase family)
VSRRLRWNAGSVWKKSYLGPTQAAAASIGKACPDGIDVLINNAGISGTIVESTEQ